MSTDDGRTWQKVASPIAGQGGATAQATFDNEQGPIVADPTSNYLYDVYAAGPRVLERRDQVIEGMEALLAPGYQANPDASPIAGEAIGGAIYSMIYEQVRHGAVQNLQELAPLATYVALAPFIGVEEACAVANGDGRGR